MPPTRLRSLVRSLRDSRVLGAAVRAVDRVWWARAILASSLVDSEYYAAQLGLRQLGRRAAVAHYVVRGFRRGMSVNPLFDETVAGGELPEVFRVPAMYAYLVSERATVKVNPWWDAVARGSTHPEHPAALEDVWSRREALIELRAGQRTETVTVEQHRDTALAAARTWASRRADRGAVQPGGSGAAVIHVVQAQDRRYHRKLEQAARFAQHGGAMRARVVLVGAHASQHVSAAVLRLIEPSVALDVYSAQTTFAAAIGPAVESAGGDVVAVLDARAQFSDDEIAALVAGARAGAAVVPAHRAQDGTLVGVGAARIGAGQPYRILASHPAEDLAGILEEKIDVPLLTGRSFAIPRRDYDAAGGLDRRLVNDGELEALSAKLARRGVALQVIAKMLPVLDEPELAFSKRSGGAGQPLASESFDDGRSPATVLIERAGYDVHGWRRGPDPHRPVPVLTWRRPHPDARRWAIKICAPAGPQGAVWGDRHFADGLANALRRRGHTVVVDAYDARLRSTAYLDDVSIAIRGPYRIDPPRTGVRLQWIISHPDEISRGELEQFDQVFAASDRWSRATANRWGVDVVPLLECTDTDLFRPRGLVRGEDIVFVGTARGIPRPSVVAPLAAGIPVRVYGPDWRPFISQRALAARSVPHDDLPARYETASIVLNDQWPAMRREGFLAMRPFDVVAVGGRVISEEVEGIDEIFDGAVVTYRDPAHLVDLLRTDPREIFPDDARLREISARIRAQHSFDARALVLDEAARALADKLPTES